jgi:hypothetical protein
MSIWADLYRTPSPGKYVGAGQRRRVALVLRARI